MRTKSVYISNPSVATEVKRALRKLGVKFTAKRMRNVAAGFYDEFGFHPLRASYDYDPARVGERRKKKKKKARRSKKTKKAKKAKRSRRRR